MSDELIGPNPCSECDGEYGRHGSCCSKASVPVSAVTDESDATTERPEEAGVCFYNGKPVMVTMMGSKPVVHFPMEGGGFATNYQPTGTFEKAVPASELTTLQSDCERWSAMYAKLADELVAVKAENERLTNRVGQLESTTMADILARDQAPSVADIDDCFEDDGSLDDWFAAGMRKHGLEIIPTTSLTALKARLAEVEAERNCLMVTGGSTNPFVVAEAIQRLKERAEAAEQRVKEIQAAWNRVAGFAVSESCGPENRFRITIDYPTLEKLQDAYRAMHDITTAIATTPPADGAQSS